MNSLENPISSSAKDKDSKAPDPHKKKSRRVAGKVIESEVKNKPENKPRFSFKQLERANDTKQKEAKDNPIDIEEDDNTAVPLETLSGEEELEAIRALRAEAREDRAYEASEDQVDQTVDEAIELYDSKIIDEGLEPEVALNEVLEEYGVEPELAISILSPSELVVNLSGEEAEGEMPLEDHPFDSEETAEPEDPLSGSSGGGKRPPTTFSPGSGGSPAQPNPWRSSRYNRSVFPVGVSSSSSYNNIRRDHKDYWSSFMSGGIVGYFIGHRRGRIKTEKKLETVKKKLERQISKLDQKLLAQEYVIRKLVKNKASSAPEISPGAKAKTKREAVPFYSELPKHETKPSTATKAESHIGKIVMAEKPSQEQPDVVRKPRLVNKPDIRAATMNKDELLKLSEQIKVDDTNLRQIYETQLVGEKGLRRLVGEYSRGGDLKQALKHEITEREMDFERDPLMRDMDSAGSSVTGTGQKALEQMIKKAEATLTSTQEETAFFKAKVSYEKKQSIKEFKQASVINNIFVVTVTILIAVIILLSLIKLS